MHFLDLIKQGRHQAIMTYVRTCKCLTIEEELALIRRGNHQEVMAYITEHWFEVEPMKEFIKKRNYNEIRHYLSCHQVVYDDMWEQLFSIGESIVNEVIDYILSDMAFELEQKTFDENKFVNKWDNVMSLILDVKDHCAIRRLITKVKLGPKSETKLLTKGNAEDKFVYDLLWGKLHRCN